MDKFEIIEAINKHCDNVIDCRFCKLYKEGCIYGRDFLFTPYNMSKLRKFINGIKQ